MATVTSLGVTFTTASGPKSVTATPAVGDLIVLVVAHTANVSSVNPTDNNSGGGGTYTGVESQAKNSSNDLTRLWIRDALITSATSTIFNHTPGGSSGGGLAVLAVSGMTDVGATAKRQSGGGTNVATGTPAVTLGLAALTTNPIIGVVFNVINPAPVMSPPAGFTEQQDVSYATPAAGLEVVSIDSGFTSATITWGNSTTGPFAVMALELNAPAVGVSLIAQARSINRFVQARTFGRVN